MDLNFSEVARVAESRPTLVLGGTFFGILALVSGIALFDFASPFRNALGMGSVFAAWVCLLSAIFAVSLLVTLVVTKPKVAAAAQLVEPDPTAALTVHELWQLMEFVRVDLRELPLTDTTDVRALVRLGHLKPSATHKSHVIADEIFDYIQAHRAEVAERLPADGSAPTRSATPVVEKKPPPLSRPSIWKNR